MPLPHIPLGYKPGADGKTGFIIMRIQLEPIMGGCLLSCCFQAIEIGRLGHDRCRTGAQGKAWAVPYGSAGRGTVARSLMVSALGARFEVFRVAKLEEMGARRAAP